MESNLKAKAFAAYGIGAEIMTPDGLGHIKSLHESTICARGWFYKYDDCKLLLKPLSSISDEDAIEVAKICGIIGSDAHLSYVGKGIVVKNYLDYCYWDDTDPMDTAKSRNDISSISSSYMLPVIDYLRSRSYLLPFLGHDLLKENIAIIKTEQ